MLSRKMTSTHKRRFYFIIEKNKRETHLLEPVFKYKTLTLIDIYMHPTPRHEEDVANFQAVFKRFEFRVFLLLDRWDT